MKKYIKNIIIFFYFAIALSGWSYYILCDLVGLKFYMFELFFVPVIFIYRKTIVNNLKKSFKSFNYLISFSLIMLCFFLGIIINPNYSMAHITTYRTLIYYIFIIGVFMQNKRINLSKLFFICMAATVGELICIQTVEKQNSTVALNSIALALIVLIPIIKGRFFLATFSTVLAFITSFLSGFRIYIIMTILVFSLALIVNLLKMNPKKAIFLISLIILSGIVIIFNFDNIARFLSEKFHMDYYSFYRVTDRLIALFKFDFVSSQDSERIMCIKRPFKEFSNSLYPSGLIKKATNEYGVYKDSPLIFLYDAFGSLITWIIVIIILLFFLVMCINTFLFRKDKYYSVLSLMGFVLLLMLFINGTFLISTYDACLSAIILGYWFNKNVGKLQERCQLW